MRRIASVLMATGLLLTLAPAAFGGETYMNARDLFANVGYAGNDGNRDWTGPWKEEGENDGPGQGMVRSVADPSCPEGSNCLLIEGGGLLNLVGAKRFVDTSDLTDIVFGYKIRRYDNSFLAPDPPRLIVEVSDDGQSWEQVASYNLNTTDENYIYRSHGVEGLSSQTFGVRFRVVDILPATQSVGVFIDFVEVGGALKTTTTTTSSTSTTSSTTTTLLPTTTTLPKITTTLPTITTTTLPDLLTTTTSSTTTTTHGSTTTTEAGNSTTSTTTGGSSDGSSGGSSGDGTTPTTNGSSDPATSGSTEPTSGADASEAPGLREASLGLQASFDDGRFGNVQTAGLDVMGIDIEPNYTMAVEVIESSWIYLLVLILLIATAIVSGLDRRRLKRAKHTDI